VTSTAGDATLTVADALSESGKLTNGAHEFASPLMVKATNASHPTGVFAPLRGRSNPLVLLTYGTWISNDAVTISLQQPVGANEPLRAGNYTKTIVFSLSTTTP
jgi:hypothetical protein